MACSWEVPQVRKHGPHPGHSRDCRRKSVPSEPKPTQPATHLIKLITKETIRVLSGGHQVLPAAWIDPK